MQRSRSAALNPQRGTGPRSAGIVLLVCFKSLNFQKAGSGKDTRTHWACLECLLEHFSLTAPSLPQHIPPRRTAAIRIPSVRPRRSEQRITGVVGSENYLLSHGCGVGCTVFLRSGKKNQPKPLTNSPLWIAAVQFTVHFAAVPEQRIPAPQRADRERKNICLHSKAEGVFGVEEAVHAAMRGAAKPGADPACGLGTERPHAFSCYTPSSPSPSNYIP